MKKNKAPAHTLVRKVGPGYIVMQVVLAVIAAVQVFPLLWLFTFSLKSNAEIFGENVLGLPREWLWSNYDKVIFETGIFRYFFNSLLITAVTIVVTGLLSAMAAFALTRLRWKLSGTVYILFLLGMMIPLHAVLLPLFITLRPVMNTHLALIIPYIGFAMPLSILVLCGAFSGIPHALMEAAVVDGASIYRVFTSILLPLTRPALATVSVLTYLSSWNELMFAITFINREEFKTLTYGIMSLTGRYVTNWGPIGAGLVIATVPSLVLYFLMSEQIQASLAAGAVKG